MAQHTLNVKLDQQQSSSFEAKQISKLGTEAKNSAQILANLRAGGSSTVEILKSMDAALHGSTEGVLQLVGKLGMLAGPGAAIALVVKALMDLDMAARETAKKMHEAFEYIGGVAGKTTRRRVLEDGVTEQEKNNAESQIKDLKSSIQDSENRILELTNLGMKSRAEGKPFNFVAAQTEIKTLEKDIAEMNAKIKDWTNVIDKYKEQEDTKKEEEKTRSTTIRDAFTESARLMDSAGTPFVKVAEKAEKEEKEKEPTLIEASAVKISSMLNNLDKLGGYTSNIINSNMDPTLSEMKRQTEALSKIEQNTKKTNGTYA